MPKVIKALLIDDSVTGRIRCHLEEEILVAYKIPRISLNESANFKYHNCHELNFSGIYFLFGTNKKGEPEVYIGQGDIRKNRKGVLNRIIEHKRNSKKDYFQEAVIIINNDNSLDSTKLDYLEHSFCNLAKNANRYVVHNDADPSIGNPSEETRIVMDQWIEKAKVLINYLGHNLFTPVVSANINYNKKHLLVSSDELTLERTIKNIGKVTAIGKQTEEGFVVRRGSLIACEHDKTIPLFVRQRRERASIDKNNVLMKDELFPNPSSAAEFVIGKSANGWDSWKKGGKTLKQLEEISCEKVTNEGKSSSDLVWYVSYGSNMDYARFMDYVKTFEHKDEPKERKAIILPYTVYFAGYSGERWNQSPVCFIDINHKGKAYCVAYLITCEQLNELVKKEGFKYIKIKIPNNIEELKGHETFTLIASKEQFSYKNREKYEKIDHGYLETITKGLKTNFDLTDEQIEAYLKKCGV